MILKNIIKDLESDEFTSSVYLKHSYSFKKDKDDENDESDEAKKNADDEDNKSDRIDPPIFENANTPGFANADANPAALKCG